MLEITQLQELIEYPFQEFFPIVNQYQFLINSNRLNCAYTPENFNNTLNKDYPFFAVHLVFSGSTLLKVDNKEYILNEGDVFFVHGGAKHNYSNYKNSKLGYMWIEFSKQGGKELFNYLQLNKTHVIYSYRTKKIIKNLTSILSYIKDNSSKNKDINFFDLSALEYTLISSLFEACHINLQTQTHIPSIVTSTLEYINENFTQNVQIQEIATKFNVSHTYLTRKFTQHMGIPPVQYLLIKKVEYASQLLLNSELSCSEIAEKTGFYDSTHFNRTFKKIMNITPLKYSKYKI